jgi:hypothetical protein
MRECKACGNLVPSRIVIDGCVKNLQRRKFCFECSPFGSKNTRDLTKPQTPRRKQNIRYTQDRRKKVKEQAIKYKNSKCALCGYDRCIYSLEFHHIDSDLKKFTIAHAAYQRKWSEVLDELDKCVLLCANCHREVEYGYREIPEDIIAQNTIRNLNNMEILNAFKICTKLPNPLLNLNNEDFLNLLINSVDCIAKQYNTTWNTAKKWIKERQNI